MSKHPVGSDLWYDPEVFAFTCLGSKEDVTLYLSQGQVEDADGWRSAHIVSVDAFGTEVRLPVEAARQLYHALGVVLEED
jgi:hypothetical protein